MAGWEYCEVDYDGTVTQVFFYDEAGEYIENPQKHARLGIVLAKLGHDGWEIISQWWRSRDQVSYTLKRLVTSAEWSETDRNRALEIYNQKHPRDRKY